MLVYNDFRCVDCAYVFDKRVAHEVDIELCPECGGYADRIYLKAPGVLMRPDGWNLRPTDPGYSKLPKVDREIHSWQSSTAKTARQPRTNVQ